MERYILSSCLTPVVRVGDSEFGGALNGSRNQHGLITREYGLTECDMSGCLILDTDATSSIGAIWFIREWLGDLSIFIAEESAVL